MENEWMFFFLNGRIYLASTTYFARLSSELNVAVIFGMWKKSTSNINEISACR